jgi:hypothetical protein
VLSLEVQDMIVKLNGRMRKNVSQINDRQHDSYSGSLVTYFKVGSATLTNTQISQLVIPTKHIEYRQNQRFIFLKNYQK